ncbi:hypothetical protein PUNSTDRAFT_137673 [Punctularia strigosozonata HHB-11173 SS5]|uniref:uncharacterized protein n=1 Tax=Punctularia strigosozonata (strain HHB-11173) TaxID=741275 RepID=UPI0004417D98|nr:uncharacterized protein PUNSTDRAFT_137673 [Punctularia strigosozonata HHB-11173 SS5]EIN05567.1 hypothetical protein PUNSTDRAFT_137673 [Punctularia strigosozonata HHB-11173 SS5]
MLTLAPQSVCDVCAEEYGPQHLPHSIPCGHVLCETCCKSIIEKAPPRLAPACPFCREHFTSEGIRKVRIDFPVTSGRNTPWRPIIEANEPTHDYSLAKEEEIILVERTSNRSPRSDARRLEDKVAKIAGKRCSVEEVSTLHKEISVWLEANPKDTPISLTLSAALLYAILINYQAHYDATKASKERIEHLENELRSKNAQYERTSQECQTLMAEISRLRFKSTPTSPSITSSTTSSYFPGPVDTSSLRLTKSAATSPYNSPPTISSSRLPAISPLHSPIHSPPMQTLSPPKMPSSLSTPSPGGQHYSPPVTPTPPHPATAITRSKSSAATSSSHTRSASASISQSLLFRSDTPTTRSHTPSIRSHTPGPRSHTPIRSTTPSLSTSSAYARPISPPPPPVPPMPTSATRKTRTLSVSSPGAPKIVRSTSDDERHLGIGGHSDKESIRAKSPTGIFSRWVPSARPASTAPKRQLSATPAPRTAFGSTVPPSYPTPSATPTPTRRLSVSRASISTPHRIQTPMRAAG